MYMKDWLHLSGKGAAVFADELTSTWVVKQIFVLINTISTRSAGGYLEMPQTGQEATRGPICLNFLLKLIHQTSFIRRKFSSINRLGLYNPNPNPIYNANRNRN